MRCSIMSLDDTGGCCIEPDRVGGGTLARGGIGGGGPLAVTEFCDCTRGGSWGNLPRGCSVVTLDVVVVGVVGEWVDDCIGRVIGLDMGETVVRVMGCACGCTAEVLVMGFCGCMVCLMVTVWDFCCDGKCCVGFCC